MNPFFQKFRKLRLRYFPSVSQRKALRIARKAADHDLPFYSIERVKPEKICLYNMPSEPSWFVFSPWNDGKDGTMLRSCRLIMVSKLSGRVLYDGSAMDEG